MSSLNAARRANGQHFDHRLPRYLIIRDDLAGKIAEGKWNFSEPMPSELRLAEQYGVSLGTMRRATDELVREGKIERRQGSGTYIRRSDFSGSLSHYLRFRSIHNTIAFQECQVSAVRLETAPSHVVEQFGLPEQGKAIFLDRKRSHGSELLVSEEIWLPKDRFAPLLTLPLEQIGSLLYRTYEEHCGQIVARAQESLKVTTANPVIATALEVEEGSPVIIIERVSFDYAGHVLEWRRSHAKAENFEYSIEIL